MKLLRENSLFAKLEKCIFEKTSLLFLGFIVSNQGFKMDPAKSKSFLKWPRPTSLHSLQCFLGFANYYRSFIKNYSHLVAPLPSLTCKGAPVKDWSAEADGAFQALKQAFLHHSCLRHLDPRLHFILEVDASSEGVGSILSQLDSARMVCPNAFFSKKFTPAQRSELE
ncbi:uncharacterized protein LOC115083355 [Rhinatrema bivittatum]|uniref:uncharacterized protein LOC115083355 n=1 Tax=Rhinatrema bivittatum TaxID=194408 RepID=UPI0011262AA1|nr:uncharacterized protein LOC115083355 [Rhinatrema bivittatum]